MNPHQGADYSGMTLNERLFAAGILEQFDTAARRRDRARMISLLLTVDVGQSKAECTVEAILANPSFYGY